MAGTFDVLTRGHPDNPADTPTVIDSTWRAEGHLDDHLFSAVIAAGSGKRLRITVEEIPEPTSEVILPHSIFVGWLTHGQQGSSSRAIFRHLTGGTGGSIPGDRHPSAPGDAGDFRRCEMLLRQVPEARTHLHRMAELSTQWGRLIPLWGDIVKSAEREHPGVFEPGARNIQTPKTTALIFRILDGAGKL